MDSNYLWQKHRAQERIQSRMKDAEANRLLPGDSAEHVSIVRRLWDKIRSILRSGSSSRASGTEETPTLRQRPSS
ncbi:MAG: hypothetical protein ACK2UK_19015 [Candidatus Promineifilaceae bacterium]